MEIFETWAILCQSSPIFSWHLLLNLRHFAILKVLRDRRQCFPSGRDANLGQSVNESSLSDVRFGNHSGNHDKLRQSLIAMYCKVLADCLTHWGKATNCGNSLKPTTQRLIVNSSWLSSPLLKSSFSQFAIYKNSRVVRHFRIGKKEIRPPQPSIVNPQRPM